MESGSKLKGWAELLLEYKETVCRPRTKTLFTHVGQCLNFFAIMRKIKTNEAKSFYCQTQICQSVCLTRAVQHPHVMTWHWGSPSSPDWPPPGCNRPPLPPCLPASPFPSPLPPWRAVSVWWNRTFGCQHRLSPRSSPATCAPSPELWYLASCHLEIDTQRQTNYGEWLKERRGGEWRRHTKRTEAERNWQEAEKIPGGRDRQMFTF